MTSRTHKALLMTLGLMAWITALVVIPLAVPMAPLWVMVIWLWLLLAPIVFILVYLEVK